MAIPKKLRLSKKSDFKILLTSGHTRYTSFAKVQISSKTNGLDYPRFAVVVPKTVERKANLRNAIRRSIAGNIQEILKNNSPLPYDYIFFVKLASNKTAKESILEELKKIIIIQ